MKNALLLFSALFLFASCNEHDHSGHDHGHNDHVSHGDAHMGDMHMNLVPDTYVEGMEKVTENASFTVRLDVSDPVPKDTGKYTWTITVLTMKGTPVDAEVKAEPTMPQHGHGTTPQFTEGTEGAETGQYILSDMDLFMPGIWQVSIEVTADGITDSVNFIFDLEG